MIDILKSLVEPLRRSGRVYTSSVVFRLYTHLTAIILMAFCVLNTTHTLFGQPIHCEVTEGRFADQSMIDSYCYTSGIFAANRHPADAKPYGIHPALGPKTPGIEYQKRYYLWIWFVLLLQSICFYFPHWLWKCCEGQQISSLVADMSLFTTDDDKRSAKIRKIVDYMYRTTGSHNSYAMKYFGCEVIAFFNVFIQMAANHLFLDYSFITYGLDWIRLQLKDPDLKIDTISDVFPILCKCDFTRFGASGGQETIDGLCVLSVNILNQMIYLFIWFWFCFLAIVSSFTLIFRLILISCPQIRYYVFRYKLDSMSEPNGHKSYKPLISGLQLDDWFIMYLLCQNVEPIVFKEIIDLLIERQGMNRNLTQDLRTNDESIVNNVNNGIRNGIGVRDTNDIDI